MKSLRTWAVVVGMAALLVASGCETTGGQTQTTIYDIHQRMVKLDKELGSSVTQLNEGTATLNARLDASDEQTRTVRGMLEENQAKLESLSRELADMKATLYRHWNLSTSGGPKSVSAGAVTIESPGAAPLTETPPAAAATPAPTVTPAPVTTPPATTEPVVQTTPQNELLDSAPLPTEPPVAATPAPPAEEATVADAGSSDPRLLYQQAQRSFANDDFAGALGQFDSYLSQFPNNDLSGNAQFWKAKCLFNLNRYDESVKTFEQLRGNFPTSTKVPFAMHNQAVAHSRLGQTAEAERLMEAVIEQYPVSPAADQARADLRKLRGEE